MTPRPVFVVDDEQQVLDSVRCLLQTEKHDVHCYQNARSFLREITPDQVGCLITDLSMPEIDGFELQERLMAMRSVLSVIIVTGRADVGAAVRLMKNGAVTLLEKPYPPEDLLKEVQHSLALSQHRAERKRLRDAARRQLALLDDDEREVMLLAAEGLPNKAISHRLALSARTVDRRRQSAQNKLDINSPSGFTRLLAQAEEEIPGLDDEITDKRSDYSPRGRGSVKDNDNINGHSDEVGNDVCDDDDTLPMGGAAL